ncbi:DUF3237 family protein [Clostridium cellulovorans]|uniref:Uncharacterized protein n=1 Tax=Clostridium cellulovorans (strain ATCC 35296 / DSM 3052 / OCM 3 / 743B) TaxID=573061 RepID=D9SX62_CLOC7|nr:DUF3237 family protein [Clostridium cellulovorans]ADL53365.1 hypothetical protein Clocel_3695 [Clostridium cellulovorans 743B]
MELLLALNIKLFNPYEVDNTALKIVMIPFTGFSQGKYFNGEIIGTGVDTQKIYNNGNSHYSARYMLAGTDYTNTQCKIFIENNGTSLDSCIPTIVTDSIALSSWQNAALFSTIEPSKDGIIVKIYKN